MRSKGINYDTGFFPAGNSSRPEFDGAVVRRELQIIAADLHCNAVRISGGDPERLTLAARHAAAAGLEVWFAPFPCEMTPAQMTPFFLECADRAEAVRSGGAEVVFVTGCELSLFAAGFIPGATVYDRMAAIMAGDPTLWAQLATVQEQANAFLTGLVASIRARFGGKITYAAGPWEHVDWSPYDIVAVDAYRDAQNASHFREELRQRLALGKPVAATEFGCCTYRGAGDRGGMGWAIVDWKSDPPRLSGDYTRDEEEQVRYLRDLLAIFQEEGVDSAFWFTFAGYGTMHRADPHLDLDMASYGVVKILESGHGAAYPDMRWEPKAVFHALAAAYAA